MIQTKKKKRQKPHFGPGLGLLDPNLAHNFFFFFFKAGLVSHYIPWSAIIMYNIKKN